MWPWPVSGFSPLARADNPLPIGEGQTRRQPYIVTCAPTRIPRSLTDQPAEGGKMFIAVGEHARKRVRLTKTRGAVTQTTVVPVRFVPRVDAGGGPY